MAGLLLLLGIAGCGSSGDSSGLIGDRAVEESPSPSWTVAPAENFAGPTKFIPDDREFPTRLALSPIEEALGIHSDPTEVLSLWTTSYLIFSEDVAGCLRTRGFPGYAVDVNSLPTVDDLVVTNSAVVEETLAEAGYGVSIGLKGPLALWDMENSGSATSGSQTFTASPHITFAQTLPVEQFEPFLQEYEHCAAESSDLNPGDPLDGGAPAELLREISDLRLQARNSAEVGQVWDDWSRCMAEKGFTARDRDALVSHIESTMAEDIAAVDVKLDEVFRGGTTNEADIEEYRSLIAPVQEYERNVVASDLACSDDVDLRDRVSAVVEKAETEWVEANADRYSLLLKEN